MLLKYYCFNDQIKDAFLSDSKFYDDIRGQIELKRQAKVVDLLTKKFELEKIIQESKAELESAQKLKETTKQKQLLRKIERAEKLRSE